MNQSPLAKKSLIVFDLDGTLTPSKSNLEPDMSAALGALLTKKKVAVIGGGSFRQFKKQFLAQLKYPKPLLSNLFLFPTTATAFYRYRGGWKKVYGFTLSKNEVRAIKKAFAEVFKQINYVPPQKTYGKVLENRGSQVTFSALGQDVVAILGKKGIRMKEAWKRDNALLKMKIARLVQEKLPKFEAHAAAFTSIDVTKRGIDKAYGVRQIKKTLKIPISKMLFIGDALYRGGNDEAAKKTGIECVAVKGPADTKKIIRQLIAD
jgi:phosphomannomutase